MTTREMIEKNFRATALANEGVDAVFERTSFRAALSVVELDRLPEKEGLKASYRFSLMALLSAFVDLVPEEGSLFEADLGDGLKKYRVLNIVRQFGNGAALIRFDMGDEFAVGPVGRVYGVNR